MKGQMYETRRRTLELLKKAGSLSIDDLSKELNITTMAVRKHLSELETDGLVSSYLERRPVGRPRYVFALTDLVDEGLFPTAYLQLALDLLDDIRALHGEGEIKRLFKRRADRLVDRYAPRLQGKPFAERAKELAKLREEAGFLIDWELSGDQLVLKEYNCSIYQIAKKYPVVCECEIEIFERLLGADVTAVSTLAGGDRCCHYIIRMPTETIPE